MTRPVLGVVAGGVLGLIDGMSAWFYPEARSMMVTIVLGSTIKGVLTGLAVGLVAKWKQSLPLGILAGALVGFVLSSPLRWASRLNTGKLSCPECSSA